MGMADFSLSAWEAWRAGVLILPGPRARSITSGNFAGWAVASTMLTVPMATPLLKRLGGAFVQRAN
jgi:hypothetical protein